MEVAYYHHSVKYVLHALCVSVSGLGWETHKNEIDSVLLLRETCKQKSKRPHSSQNTDYGTDWVKVLQNPPGNESSPR